MSFCIGGMTARAVRPTVRLDRVRATRPLHMSTMCIDDNHTSLEELNEY